MAYNGRVDIWIKQEDRAKWDAIVNKPKWLHRSLERTDTPEIEAIKRELDKEVTIPIEPTVTPMEETIWSVY